MNRRLSSLRNRTIFHFALIAILPIIAVGVITLWSMYRYMSRDIDQRNLALIRSISTRVSQFIDSQESSLRHIAMATLGEGTEVPRWGIRSFLGSFRDLHPALRSIYLIDPNGYVMNTSPLKFDLLGENISSNPHVNAALITGKSILASSRPSSSSHEPPLVIAIPSQRGVVLGFLDLSEITDQIAGLITGREARAVLCDENGFAIGRSNDAGKEKIMDLSGFPPIRMAREKGEGTLHYNDNGRNWIAAVSSVPNVGWHLAVVQPSSEAFAPLIPMAETFLAALVVGLGLAFFQGYMGVRYILKRLERINETFGQIAAGRYEKTIKSDQIFREFMPILEDLQTMAEAIRQRESALKAAKVELEDKNQKLKDAIEYAGQLASKAEAANMTKSQFLANMSHELRTPFNAIMGMTELALNTELTAEQREYLDIVMNSSSALLTLVNQILDLSKVEAGKLDLELLGFDLRDSLGDAVRTLAGRAHEKGLELIYHVLPDVPNMLIGDPSRLRQIVLNLAGNAIKFTEKGEVVVRIAKESTNEKDICLNFSITDTGIGVPPEKQQLIFDPFSQADNSTTRKYGGTGLGLTISAQLVELMGGRIWMESEIGKGTQFHFTARFGLQKGDTESTLPAELFDLKDMRVLVTDDNETNLKILDEMLAGWDMKSTLAKNGREALDHIKKAAAEGKTYPLVILDFMMPGMDGIAVAKEIFGNSQISSTRIIILTSAGLRGDAAHCREIGVSAYLTKPVKQSDLLDTIMTTMAQPAPFQKSMPLITRHSLREERSSSAKKNKKSLKLLVAEDNRVNQKLMLMMLEKEGHSVVLANNGKEALKALDNDFFDLILMDVQMPEMDGLEATAAIRLREKGANIPIIALTAHAMKGDRERCIEAGMNDYITKPIKREIVFKMLEKWTLNRA